MAIAAQTLINTYTGNGSTTSFPYTFKVFYSTQIVVSVNDVIQSTGFSITGIGVDAGGTIVFTTAPATGSTIRITRNSPRTRATDFVVGGAFDSTTLDNDLDYLTSVAQEIDSYGLHFNSATGLWDATSLRISNVPNPVNALDVANKQYADSVLPNVQSYATAASNSASAASTSATNSANSATASATSASNASTSATNSANSATAAANSANAATFPWTNVTGGISYTGGNANVSGNLTVGGTSTVTGNIVANGGITISGTATAPTAAQFDNTTKLATTAFVRTGSGSLSGFSALNASATLTLAQLGTSVQFSGSAAGQILTLPAVATVPSGAGYWIENLNPNPVTIKANGSENVLTGHSGVNSFTLNNSETIFVHSQSGGQWNLFGATAAQVFPLSLATNGYQKLPSGLIIQWGMYNASDAYLTEGVYTITYPVSFPVTTLNAIATGRNSSQQVAGGSHAEVVNASASQLSLFIQADATGSTTNGIYWTAKGY